MPEGLSRGRTPVTGHCPEAQSDAVCSTIYLSLAGFQQFLGLPDSGAAPFWRVVIGVKKI